jgi:2'-5' RNA ligase
MSETALVVAVPEAERVVELLRRQYTVDGAEGMPPHITLLYPFADADTLNDDRMRRLTTALSPFRPFAAALSAAGRFQRQANTVLWLAPEPAEPLIAMTEALAAEFPEHPPYGGVFESTVPHLTVAVTSELDLLDRIESRLLDELPIETRIEEVRLYEHRPGAWQLVTRFRLAGG